MHCKIGEFFHINFLFVCLLPNPICHLWCKMTSFNGTDFIRQQAYGVCTYEMKI